MKEATGEVSMTVITIVILALLVGIGTWLFAANGPARNWIEDLFNKQVDEYNNGIGGGAAGGNTP